MKILAKHPVILVLVIVLISYLAIFSGFFQQDEWLSFAYRMVALEGGFVGVVKDSLAPSVGHFQPLNSLLISILYYLFRVNYSAYAAISILLHLVNVFLFYRLTKKFLKDEKASLAISLIFGVSASIYQATSWVLADLGVHLATLFTILTLSSLVSFLKSNSRSDFNRVLVYTIVSILFKEISISLFPFVFVILFFAKSIKDKKRFLFKLIGFFVVYILIRASMYFMPTSYSRDRLVTESQYPAALSYNLITLPAKGLVQSIFPPRLLIGESYLLAQLLPQELTGEPQTPSYDLFVQKKVLEGVNVINFLIIMSLCLFLIRRSNNSTLRFGVLSALVFVFLGSPIFGLAPERSGRIFIIDSRNLYLLALGSSFIIYSTLYFLFQKRMKLLFLATLAVVLLNIYGLDKEFVEISQSGTNRKEILNEIYMGYPNLPSKAVFFIESDSSYYGLPEEQKILPFQSGLGQTLLVWYGRKGDLPSEFYSDRFLWEITDQGYKEYENRGFGYFRDYELLKATIKEYNLSNESVISYKWLSKENKIVDVTEEIRERLKNEKNNK